MPDLGDDLTQQDNATKQENQPKGGSKKVLFIIIGVVLFAVIGISLALVLGGSGDDAGQQDDESTYDEEYEDDGQLGFEKPHFKQWELDTFVVNLSTGSRYLRTRILLEYDENLVSSINSSSNDKDGGHGGSNNAEILKKKEPIIKDTIITILSSQKAIDLLSPEGKEEVKKEIINKVNYALGGNSNLVTNIYFSEFIIQ